MAVLRRFHASARAGRQWRPRTYWQVWLAVIALPLAVLILEVGLRLVFHTWPQWDVFGTICTFGYIVVAGSTQSRALRRRRLALPTP
jgi:hypothetical protein